MKTTIYYWGVSIGTLLLILPMFSGTGWNGFHVDQGLIMTVLTPNTSDQNRIRYEIKIKNTQPSTVRLCGGRTKCGCHFTSSFPVFLDSKQEITIIALVNPCNDETELTLYADGKGLNGLTPVKIQLPAVSLISP